MTRLIYQWTCCALPIILPAPSDPQYLSSLSINLSHTTIFSYQRYSCPLIKMSPVIYLINDCNIKAKVNDTFELREYFLWIQTDLFTCHTYVYHKITSKEIFQRPKQENELDLSVHNLNFLVIKKNIVLNIYIKRDYSSIDQDLSRSNVPLSVLVPSNLPLFVWC